MKAVEIVAIGDELLRGIVAESNSHWLAKRVAARGASLERVTVLPDRPDVVAAELRAAFARAPALLVTHGGLGPTDDDRTREMIAAALGVPQARDPDAEAIVRRRYAELADAGAVAYATPTDARLRMADLPRGARALDNHVGAAPGFWLERAATTLVALPGVPPELRWIWERPLAPLLDRVLGPGGFAEATFRTTTRDESSVAAVLRRVQERHRGVYVKSRAHSFEPDDPIRVTLHATGASDDDARGLVEAAGADLRAALAAEGVGLTSDDATR